jgi:asparagine synthase (glutamine-hydrolysing)
MCGLAGEYRFTDEIAVDAGVLDRRAELIRHRGPDARGSWVNHHVGMSHVRLKLLDPQNGLQPMRSPKGNVLSYNGEIYNNTELRAELLVRGYRFETRSDTEVLLAAYETWGERTWERLNGMFSFALYDPTLERLYLVRDRLGVKPMLYRVTDRGVEFGSEPSAWEDLRSDSAEVDPQGILNFLRFAQPVFGDRSVYAGLKALEPGTQLVVDRDGVSLRRWFSPVTSEWKETSEPRHIARARIYHLLHMAVGRQMIADAPVGVSLSGGVDSAIITGLMAQMRPEPPIAFTIALENDEEELAPARAVARKWKCPHREIVISPAEFFRGMRELISLRQLPVAFPNEVLIYLLARRASQEVKAILTGEGADELFGGYTRILSSIDQYLRGKEAAGVGDPLLLNTLKAANPNLDYHNDPRFFASAYSWFNHVDLEILLNDKWRRHAADNLHPALFERQLESFGAASPRNRFHLLLEYAHLTHLLARLDGATMGASVEGRVPYTDTELVRYLTSLDPEMKFSGSGPDKPLLRETFADLLPPEVLQRPKRAFDASLHRLFGSPEGHRELSLVAKNVRMSEFFDGCALQTWMNENTVNGDLQKTWLLLSLSMWLSRNML